MTEQKKDEMVEQAHKEMLRKGGATKTPIRVQEYNRKNRSWRFSFHDPSGEQQTFEFTLSADPFTSSYNSLCKKTKSAMIFISGKIVKDNGELGEILFNSKASIPNMWPGQDPHKVYDEGQASFILMSVIRDINEEIIRRHISDWLMNQTAVSGALSFDLKVV